ncbi:MAG: hypothetical protein KIS66_12130 [Fimbriimonadaceae bacterium]|nr:hypothetical protein [Fimbriimonadaceae bacterium]
MKELKLKPEQAWNVVSVIAIVAIVALFWMALHPPSANVGNLKEVRKARREDRSTAEKASEKAKQIETSLASLTWKGSADEIGPQALGTVTRLAQAAQVTATAFRPQRIQDDGGLPQMAFLVTVEGRYPNVVSLLRNLEKPETKMAVTLLQMASADASNDMVNATIGLTAFIQELKKSAPAKKNPKDGPAIQVTPVEKKPVPAKPMAARSEANNRG